MKKLEKISIYLIAVVLEIVIFLQQPVETVYVVGEGNGLKLTLIAWLMMLLITFTVYIFLKNETVLFKENTKKAKTITKPAGTPEWLKKMMEEEDF